jgi:uncharacterized membrane protein/cytochrome c2
MGATDAARGAELIQSKGCLVCHSIDGSAKSGPTFKDLMGREGRVVMTTDGAKQVTVDEAYIARSLRDPNAEIAAGYSRGSMPKFDVSDDDAAAITAYLRNPSSAPVHGPIAPLASAAVAFVLLHFFLSSIGVRKQVIAAIGDKGFRTTYSILITLSFVAMIVFYRSAPLVDVWSAPRWTHWIPIMTMPLALLFLVAGFSTPSPTVVGQEARAAEPPQGIQAVTRHPGLWGFAIWALGHLAANGELRVMIVAAAILVLAVGGMFHIDARRRATSGDSWTVYANRTSVVPFAAILQRRATLVPAEIGTRRIAIAAAVYLLLFFAHPYVIGASPAP